MFVLEVIPLSSSAPQGTLSYRSTVPLKEGALVSILLRKSRVQGLVVACEDAKSLKGTLKAASYMLSRSAPTQEGTLHPAYLAAASRLASYHAASTGSVLRALFAAHLENDIPLPESLASAGLSFKEGVLELPLSERITHLSQMAEKSSASKGSLLLVVPTIAELSLWKYELREWKPRILSGNTPKARRREIAEDIAETPGLTIVTPAYAWLPVANLSVIVVERVSAGTYRARTRPYLDHRISVRERARAEGVPLHFSDFPLPLEYRPMPTAPLSRIAASLSVYDVRRPVNTQQSETPAPYAAVPPVLVEEISQALLTDSLVAVLAARRGYAPVVVCRDCGQTIKDERGNTLSFSQKNGVPVFRSSDGHTVIPAKMLCPRCGSWNLMPLGVGVERVVEELIAAFPNEVITFLEADTLKSTKGLAQALSGITSRGIIVGTESMLPWLRAARIPVSSVVVASADSLLALPFWRSRERFLRLVHMCASLADRVHVATRAPEDTAVKALTDLSAKEFFAEETLLRKALGYPPFGTLVKIEIEVTSSRMDALEAEVRSLLEDITATKMPDVRTKGNMVRRSLVLTFPEGVWPNEELSRRLSSLPPSVRVLVDPESF